MPDALPAPALADRVAADHEKTDGRPDDPTPTGTVATPSTVTAENLDLDLVRFGRAVATARKRDGWTQAEAAVALGISRTYFAQIESAKAKNLTLRLARQVGHLFTPPVSLDDGGDDLRAVCAELLQSHAAWTYDLYGDERPAPEDVALIARAQAVLGGMTPEPRPPVRPTLDALLDDMERQRRKARLSTDALVRALREEREAIAALSLLSPESNAD